MKETEQQSDSAMQTADDQPVTSYGLLYITRAYNRSEITFGEWLEQSRKWAECIIRQYGKGKISDKR